MKLSYDVSGDFGGYLLIQQYLALAAFLHKVSLFRAPGGRINLNNSPLVQAIQLGEKFGSFVGAFSGCSFLENYHHCGSVAPWVASIKRAQREQSSDCLTIASHTLECNAMVFWMRHCCRILMTFLVPESQW